MGSNRFIGWAGYQDPIYGIRRKNLVERLTEANWTTKALIRKSNWGLLYVWLWRDGLEEDALERDGAFRVNVALPPGGDARQDFEAEFDTLAQALAYANGDDGGRITTETRPAPVEEWPQEQPVGATITCGRSVPVQDAPGPNAKVQRRRSFS